MEIGNCDELKLFYYDIAHTLKDNWNENNFESSLPLGKLRTSQGHLRTWQGQVWAVKGHSECKSAAAGQYKYELVYCQAQFQFQFHSNSIELR